MKKKPTLNMKAVMATDTGKHRDKNEDYACIVNNRTSAINEIRILLAIADGVALRSAGAVCSVYAIDLLKQIIDTKSYRELMVNGDYLSLLKRIFHEVNAKVRQLANANPDYKGMATTLTAVVVVNDQMYYAYLGDSPIFLIRDSNINQLTQAHLWVDEQIERGNLTPQDTESHPLRDAISRAIGVSDSVQVDSGSMILKDGDTVLLATDGLTDLVSVEEIRDVAISYPFKRTVKTLIELANVRGGYDNITCILAQFKSKKFRWFLR